MAEKYTTLVENLDLDEDQIKHCLENNELIINEFYKQYGLNVTDEEIKKIIIEYFIEIVKHREDKTLSTWGCQDHDYPTQDEYDDFDYIWE